MSGIIGPAAAITVLETLLSSTAVSLEAVKDGSTLAKMQAMEQAKTRLIKFADQTRAADLANAEEVDAIAKIDKIARDAVVTLTSQQIDAGLDALREGASRLEQLATQLDVHTDAASGAAENIALTPVKKTVGSLTAMVGSLEALKSQLDTGNADQKATIEAIERLAASFQELRTSVGI